MTKTREDNVLIDRTSVVCVKNDNELSWSIKLGTIYDEN